MQDNNIKHLIHLGDVVDRRKFINHQTGLSVFRKRFFDRLYEEQIDTHIIIAKQKLFGLIPILKIQTKSTQ